jgi:hypothetical protein
MNKFLFAVLALSLLVPALPMAHPGHEHKTMGTIAKIEKDTLVVKPVEGKDVTFQIIPTTAFKRGKDKGTQADLKAGMRVVVVSMESSATIAREIQYSTVATTEKK